MKFLVDNQLPPALARYIAEDLKSPATHVQDVGLDKASDIEVWTFASQNGLILVTKDEDFVSLFSKQPTGRLLWVRLQNCRKHALFSAFKATWSKIVDRFESGESFVEFR